MKEYKIILKENNNSYGSFELNDKDFENIIEIKKQFINKALLQGKSLTSFLSDNGKEAGFEFNDFLDKTNNYLKNGGVKEHLTELNKLFEDFFDKYFEIKEKK